MAKESDDIFRISILNQIRQHLDKCENLFELCKLLMGPTPIEVLEISTEDEFIFKSVRELSDAGSSQPHGNMDDPSFRGEKFPEPLLIDADWRYTAQSAKKILEVSNAKLRNKSICLGSPTIFAELLNNNLDCLMIDRNNLICDHFKKFNNHNVICADVHKFDIVKFIKEFDSVFIDPPWYMNKIYNWLSVAIGVTSSTGDIFMPMYTENLRPNAKKEIELFFQILSDIGIVTELMSTVDYVVPSYEKIVFQHHNVTASTSWRRANLLRLDVTNCDTQTAIFRLRQAGGITSDEFSWKRFQIGNKSYAVDTRLLNSNSVYTGKLTFKNTISSRSKNKQKFNFIDSENNTSLFHQVEFRKNDENLIICTNLDNGKICLDTKTNPGEIYAEYYNSSLSELRC